VSCVMDIDLFSNMLLASIKQNKLLFQLTLQGVLSYGMVKKWGSVGNTWYRSIVCGVLGIRGLMYLRRDNYEEDEKSCDIIRSYFLIDFMYLLSSKRKRKDLILHHIIWYTVHTILSTYRTTFQDKSWVSQCRNLVFIAELISAMNGPLRKNKKRLRQWRLFMICCFRLPTLLTIMIPAVFKRGDSNPLPLFPRTFMKFVSVFAPFYDVYMLKKMKFHLCDRTI